MATTDVMQARSIERDLADIINAARIQNESCQKRVKQLQLAIDSDLFAEFEEDDVNRLRELADSARVQFGLLAKDLELGHQRADKVDEASAVVWSAETLKDEASAKKAQEVMARELELLQDTYSRSEAICSLIAGAQQRQETIFARMRR